MTEAAFSRNPEETFLAGEAMGRRLHPGDLVLLTGGLGAGKTLFAKGVLSSLGIDADEVTSPSFALVNLYHSDRFDVYHIDLWRLDPASDPAESVDLDEILENPNAVTIIEWADRLGEKDFVNHTVRVFIEGDGDDPRRIAIEDQRS